MMILEETFIDGSVFIFNLILTDSLSISLSLPTYNSHEYEVRIYF